MWNIPFSILINDNSVCWRFANFLKTPAKSVVSIFFKKGRYFLLGSRRNMIFTLFLVTKVEFIRKKQFDWFCQYWTLKLAKLNSLWKIYRSFQGRYFSMAFVIFHFSTFKDPSKIGFINVSKILSKLVFMQDSLFANDYWYK